MPEPKRPLKVFLCHAHADRDSVRGLYARLTQDGVDAWLDKEKLLGGADWEYEIRNAVRESDVVVICHSKQFNQKGFRQKEVKIALEEADLLPKGEIFIIPVRLEECDVLDDLKRWHWVDLFEADGYERLLRALRTRADRIGATLQIKKNWLPKVNTQPAVVKIPSLPIEKNEKKPDRILSSPKRKLNIKKIIAVMAQSFLVVIVVSGLIFSFWNPLNQKVDATPTSKLISIADTQVVNSPAPFVLISETPSPTPEIDAATSTSLPTETSASSPALSIGSTMISNKDGMIMVYVPEGNFTMGSDSGYSNERPAHTVFLDAFWIDRTEVTHRQFSECVGAGACGSPLYVGGYARNYFFEDKYAEYPIKLVSWEIANSYCEWVGRRLPAEAEWEKAARGTDGRIYPWGNEIPNCSLANVPDCTSLNTSLSPLYYLSPVGSYPDGESPYGTLDMIGNVQEWVADWYDETYYSTSPNNNPLGPDSGRYRVARGGSDQNIANAIFRVFALPDYKFYRTGFSSDIGFRCAMDANP